MKQIISFLQEDLKNERKHMNFYLHAGVMVQGLHRQEFSEFLLKEARSEMDHVEEFSKLIFQLGEIPLMDVNNFPQNLTDPLDIIRFAREMEYEVSRKYAFRLEEIEDLQKADILADDFDLATCHYASIFYENQLEDSYKSALELKMFLMKN